MKDKIAFMVEAELELPLLTSAVINAIRMCVYIAYSHVEGTVISN